MYYDLNKIMKKMETMLDQADIPYEEPFNIAFSFDMGTALGACYYLPNTDGQNHYAIRIHPFFDSPDVAPVYVESIVCHELIHCDVNGRHDDQWETRAAQFIRMFPEYDLPALNDSEWEMNPNGDCLGLPFNTEDYVIYCPHCGKRLYFRCTQRHSIAHYLSRPCSSCGSKMETFFKGRKHYSHGRTKLKNLQDLRTGYKGEL